MVDQIHWFIGVWGIAFQSWILGFIFTNKHIEQFCTFKDPCVRFPLSKYCYWLIRCTEIFLGPLLSVYSWVCLMIMKVKVNATVFSVTHHHIHHSKCCQCVQTTRDVNRQFRPTSETHASTSKTEEDGNGGGERGGKAWERHMEEEMGKTSGCVCTVRGSCEETRQGRQDTPKTMIV